MGLTTIPRIGLSTGVLCFKFALRDSMHSSSLVFDEWWLVHEIPLSIRKLAADGALMGSD